MRALQQRKSENKQHNGGEPRRVLKLTACSSRQCKTNPNPTLFHDSHVLLRVNEAKGTNKIAICLHHVSCTTSTHGTYNGVPAHY